MKRVKLKDIKFDELGELLKVSESEKTGVMLEFLRHNPSLEEIGEQILVYIVENYEPILDGKLFGKENIKTAWDIGLYRYLMLPRSKTTGLKQTDKKVLPYCSLVPMYMAAFKKYRGIEYSKWTNVESIVEAQLFLAMESGSAELDVFNVDSGGLLRLRDKHMMRGDKPMNPETYHAVHNLKDSILEEVPIYARAMLLQYWCAHPVNRNEYMILDPRNWDNMPKPLVDVEVIKHDDFRLPWD